MSEHQPESKSIAIGNGYYYRIESGDPVFTGIPECDPVWSHSQWWFVTGRRARRRVGQTRKLVTAFAAVINSAGKLMYALVRKGLVQPAFTNQRKGQRVFANEMKPTIVRTNPMRPREFESDVLVPLQQSAITGVTAAAVAVTIVFGIDKYVIINADIVLDGYLYIGGLIGLYVTARSWWSRVSGLDDVIYNVEEMTSLDINQDKQIGDPGIAPRRIPLNTSRGQVQIEAPNPTQKIHVAKWQRLAYLHLHCGVKLSRRAIVSESKKRDGIALSQNDYAVMLKALENANMMKNGSLTQAGKQFLFQRLPNGIGG